MSRSGAVRVSTWAHRTPPPAVAVRRAGSTVTVDSARVSTSTPWSTPATGPCPVARTATGIPRSAANRTAARTSCSSVTETATSGVGIAERSNPAHADTKPGVPGRWNWRATVLVTRTPSPPALQPCFNPRWRRWNRVPVRVSPRSRWSACGTTRAACPSRVRAAAGLALTVIGPLLTSRLLAEPTYDVILGWDPDAVPADWLAVRRRYFALNWVRAVFTWVAFALFLAASYVHLR